MKQRIVDARSGNDETGHYQPLISNSFSYQSDFLDLKDAHIVPDFSTFKPFDERKSERSRSRNQSFSRENSFSGNNESSLVRRRDRDRNNIVLIFEIDARDCSSSYKELSLRELLSEVLQEVNQPPTANDAKSKSEIKLEVKRELPEGPKGPTVESSADIDWEDTRQPVSLHQERGRLYTMTRNTSSRSAYAYNNTNTTGDGAHGVHHSGKSRVTSSVLDLRIRDLRRLDFSINTNEELTVQVRRHVVLFSVDPIRAIVTSGRLRIFVPPGADSLMKFLEEYMKDWLLDKDNLCGERSNAHFPVAPGSGSKAAALASRLYTLSTDLSHAHSPAPGSPDSCLADEEGEEPIFIESPAKYRRGNTMNLFVNSAGNSGRATNPDSGSRGGAHDPSITTVVTPSVTTYYGISFEIHAYESLLSTVKDIIRLEFEYLRSHAGRLLAFFKEGAMVSPLVQEKLRYLKDKIARLSSKLKSYRQSLDDVIEDDETMALMNLTPLAAEPQLYRYPLSPAILCQHEEIEEALESYLTDYSSYESQLEFIRSQILSAEAQASLRLDISRNKVLVANIILSICSVFAAVGSYIAGIFGMNLDNVNTIQPYNGSFGIVWALSVVVMVAGGAAVYYYMVWTEVIPVEKAYSKDLKKLKLI